MKALNSLVGACAAIHGFGGLRAPAFAAVTLAVILGAVRADADPLFGSQFLQFNVEHGSRAFAIGDMNGDGRPDLVAADGSVLLGHGDGTFGAEMVFGTGWATYSAAIRDLNGDGKPDLASANWGSNTASVLLGNGDGTFETRSDFGTGGGPRSIAIGDLNDLV